MLLDSRDIGIDCLLTFATGILYNMQALLAQMQILLNLMQKAIGSS